MEDIAKYLELVQAAGGWGTALILLKLFMNKDKDYKVLVKSTSEEAKEQTKQMMNFALKSTEHITEQTKNTELMHDAIKDLTQELRRQERG